MCEQSPLHYKHGDIVWVKMGICWWPGEVVEFEKLPEDVRNSFKKGTKLPLVTVTFFQEDNYEYVKNLSHIYVYNCSKKDDFIRKGMDLIRAKNAFMEKFPSDIRIAEEKTNGNVDILEDPKYGPDNKQEFLTVVSQVFGSPTKKRISLGKGGKRKSSLSSKTPTSAKKSTGRSERNVTHPRFLGISNDHEVRVLIQTETQHTREARDEKIYYCQTCDFSSTRINVIVMHNQSHLHGNYTPTTSKKATRTPNRKLPKKSFKIPLSKTSTIDEELALLKSGIALSDVDTDTEDEDRPKPKNKRKKKSAGDKSTGKKTKVEQKVEKKDIRIDLLKEWDDDDDEEEEASVVEEQSKTEPSSSKKEDSTCFDFNDDDEKEIITTAAAGRKIPRVIPDKRKSTEPTEDANLPTAENDVNRTDQIEKNDSTEKPLDVDAFNDILEATKVPELPEVPQSLKCEQNFHSTRTIKFPDKPLDSPGPEVHIKKRFVKSFEDFEMSLKLIREKEDLEKREKSNNESAIEDTSIPDEECLKPAINNGQELNQSQTDEKHIDSSNELKLIETVESEIIETPKESKDEVNEENQNTNDNYKIKRNLRGSQSESRSKSPVRTDEEAKTRRKKRNSEKSLPEKIEKPEDISQKSKSNENESSEIEDSGTTSKLEEPVIDKNLESEKQDEPEINISKPEEVSQTLEDKIPEKKEELEEKVCEIENVPVEKVKRETRRSRRTKSSSIEKVEVEIKVDEHKDSISIEAVTLPVEETKDPENTTSSEQTKTSNDFEDNHVSKEKPCDTVQEPVAESVKSPLIEERVEKNYDSGKTSKKSHERTSRRKKSTDKYESFEEKFNKRQKSALESLREKHDEIKKKVKASLELFEEKPSKHQKHDNDESKKRPTLSELFDEKPSKSKHFNLEEPTKSRKHDSFEEPARSKKRDSFEEPARSKKHDFFDEPSKSKKHDFFDEPSKSKKHDFFDEPSKSKKHDEPSKPKKHDFFDEPSKSKKHDFFDEPSKSKKHDFFDEPSRSKKHDEPSKSKKHDFFDEPSRSKKHDNLEEPLKSKKHENLEEPSKSRRRDNTEESSKSKRHDNLVEASKAVKHDNLEEPSKSKKEEKLEEPSRSKRHETSKSKRHDNLEESSEGVKHDNLHEQSKSKKDEGLEEPSKSKRHDNLDDKASKVDESKRRKLSEFDFERSYKSKSKAPYKDEEKKIETESDHGSKKTLSRMHSSEDIQNKKLKTHEENTTENSSKYENRRDKYYKSSKKLRPHKQEVTVATIETEVESKTVMDEEEKETKSGLKVSKLKSQLMNKLNEPEAESEPTPATRTRSHSKTEPDVTEDTENKHPSKRPRTFSLHTEEIVIEKSVDKVEVTIHKEETESQNAEAAEEKPKEGMEIEVELSLPEKQVQLEQVEAPVEPNENNVIEGDKQSETILETDENKGIEVPEITEPALASVEEVVESKLEESIEVAQPDIDIKLPETKSSYDEIAAVNTLASISEMRSFGMVPSEHEINIEKNVTVVSESDLADGQVEIAKMPIIEEGTLKATTTITSFSVDFTGDMELPKSEETSEKVCVIIPEKPQPKIEEKSVPEETIPKEVESEISENVPEVTVEMEMAKLTDTNIETTVAPQPQEGTTSTKLLEILTDAKVRRSQQEQALKAAPRIQPNLKISNPKFNLETREQIVKPKGKVVVRSAIPGTSKTIKPVILSEKKITSSLKDGALQKVTPKDSESGNLVSVQKVCSKKFDDIEDIDTFIIKKPSSSKKSEDEEIEPPKMLKKVMKPPKTKILEHAILKPATKDVAAPVKADDNVFDIDSMPIVLSDQILTPESLENMPIMIQQENAAQNTPKPVAQIRKIQPPQQMKLLNKSPSPIIKQTIRGVVPSKTPMKQIKTGKVLTPTSAIMKHNPSIITQTSKGSKFVIVTSEVPSTPTVNKYTVGKRQFIKKNSAILTGSTNKVLHGVSQDASGNKIMIVTNNKGQQQQVVLTPTSQKMIPHSATKKIYKGTVQKDVTKSPNIISQTIINSKGQITTTNPSVFTSSSSISKKPRIEPTSKNKILGQKLVLQGSLNQIKGSSGQPRTIIIKNPQGQTVKKIQGTDDALLEKQVAEQLEAINRAASQQSQTMTFKSQTKRYSRKTLTESTKLALQNKAQMVLNTSPTVTKSTGSIPPLAPISPIKKTDSTPAPISKVSSPLSKPPPPKLPATTPTPAKEVEKSATTEKPAEPKRAPHQLVIQDALGNQTTIVEGQILALPSETVDGQPQSYMLVTVDETGNLTPLNNEALMSLDPNLVGDLGANMVLQVDQGTPSTEIKEAEASPPPAKVEEVVPQVVETEIVPPPEPVIEEKLPVPEIPEPIAQTAADPSQMQAVACAINNGETNQQLIITGDPISTQKFLESLTEGNADLANLLANAEGNILIHAEGQQILINTDSDNQMLLTLNSESSMEGGEGSGNPIFSSQAPKNQDILAAALADTDVFQPESSVVPSSKVPSSQLSPGGPLYPINVNNVLETSSMSSPIMTPLEVPSTNSKKIDDTDILSQVPKNVDLPITITDPNIAQTVAHQQVLMSDELHTNLELPLAIADVAVTSAGMNSPSFGYSLPTLDDSVDMQKPFTSSISMPLLTEEPEDVVTTSSVSISATLPSDIIEKPIEKPETDVPVSQEEDAKTKDELTKTESSSLIKQYLLATSGLSAINNQMCNSLSEPPPDMFDFTIDQSFEKLEKSVTSSTDEEYVSNIESEKSDDKVESEISTPNTNSEINSPSTTSTDSCEIPVQPDIVTDIKSAENSNNSKDSEM